MKTEVGANENRDRSKRKHVGANENKRSFQKEATKRRTLINVMADAGRRDVRSKHTRVVV